MTIIHLKKILLLKSNTHLIVSLLSLILFSPINSYAAEPGHYWQDVSVRIAQYLQQAEDAYQNDDSKSARRKVVQAYFGEFEGSKMEAGMRMELGSKHTWLVEKKFGGLRKAIKNKAAKSEVSELATALIKAINDDAIALDEAGISAEVFQVNE